MDKRKRRCSLDQGEDSSPVKRRRESDNDTDLLPKTNSGRRVMNPQKEWQSRETIFIRHVPIENVGALTSFLERKMQQLPHRHRQPRFFSRKPIVNCRVIEQSRIAFLRLRCAQDTRDILRLNRCNFSGSTLNIELYRGVKLPEHEENHPVQDCGAEEENEDDYDPNKTGQKVTSLSENREDVEWQMKETVFVTGLPAGLEDGAALTLFLEKRKRALFHDHVGPKNVQHRSIVACRMTKNKRSAVLKVRSRQDSLELVKINGQMFKKHRLHIKPAYGMILSGMERTEPEYKESKNDRRASRRVPDETADNESDAEDVQRKVLGALCSNRGGRQTAGPTKDARVADEFDNPTSSAPKKTVPPERTCAPSSTRTSVTTKMTSVTDEMRKLVEENAALKATLAKSGHELSNVMAHKQEVIDDMLEAKMNMQNMLLAFKTECSSTESATAAAVPVERSASEVGNGSNDETKIEGCGNDRSIGDSDGMTDDINVLSVDELRRRLRALMGARTKERSEAERRLTDAMAEVRSLRVELDEAHANQRMEMSFLTASGANSADRGSKVDRDSDRTGEGINLIGATCIDLTDESSSGVGVGVSVSAANAEVSRHKKIVASLMCQNKTQGDELEKARSSLTSVQSELDALRVKHASQGELLSKARADLDCAESKVRQMRQQQQKFNHSSQSHQDRKSLPVDSGKVAELRRKLSSCEEDHRLVSKSLALQTTELASERRARRSVESALEDERRARRSAEDALENERRARRSVQDELSHTQNIRSRYFPDHKY